MQLIYLRRRAAENRTRIFGICGVHHGLKGLPSITQRAFAMRIVRCPHHTPGPKVIQLAKAEKVILESGVTIIMPIMASHLELK